PPSGAPRNSAPPQPVTGNSGCRRVEDPVNVDYTTNLIEDAQGIAKVLRSAHRIAVLGIKTEQQAGQPSFDIPAYLVRAGFDVVPVPVYYPEVTEILGRPVYRSLQE